MSDTRECTCGGKSRESHGGKHDRACPEFCDCEVDPDVKEALEIIERRLMVLVRLCRPELRWLPTWRPLTKKGRAA
jgi:hypothetical protein